MPSEEVSGIETYERRWKSQLHCRVHSQENFQFALLAYCRGIADTESPVKMSMLKTADPTETRMKLRAGGSIAKDAQPISLTDIQLRSHH